MSHSQIILFSLILLLLILISAFFSCAETALMAINRYRLRHHAQRKKPHAIRILQLLKRPDRLLGAILIGNTFATILSSSLATMIAYHFWGNKGGLLAAIMLTFVMLIFSEIAPKTLAAIYPEHVARWVAYPIQFILRILYPVVWSANAITNGLLRMLRVRVKSYAIEPLTREELRSIVHETAGKISRQYQNMLLGILDLNQLTVDDVMVPCRDISGLDLEQSWETILKQIHQCQREWVPVYRHHVNQMIGILYLRDVLKLLLQPGSHQDRFQQLIHEAYFVPEGTPLPVQLDYFQQSRDKVAFVVDEYGEIQGLLTLEDILEEIIGDFSLSLTHGKRIEQQEDGSYLIDGTITIREFNRATEFELPLYGPKTVNGLIVEYLEALPHAGSAVLIADYPIEIIQVKENRVKLARIFPRYSHTK